MSQQIKLRNAELLNIQSNVEKKTDTKENSSEENNGKLIERINLKNTPFTLIRTEVGCFGCVGKYRVTEIFKTIPEVEEYLMKINWDTIVATIIAIIEGEIALKAKNQ